MKCNYLLLLLFLSSYGFAQESFWIQYDVDKSIKVDLPNKPNILDTLGTKMLKSESNNYIIVITRIVNDKRINANIPNDEELLKFYDGIVKGFKKSVNGELLEKETINISNLTSIKYRLKVTRNGEANNYFVITVFVNNTIYSFQFYQPESEAEIIKIDRERFFNSIKISRSLQHKDQFTTNNISDDVNKGEVFGELLFFVLIALIPVIYIIWRIRRKHITRFTSRQL